MDIIIIKALTVPFDFGSHKLFLLFWDDINDPGSNLTILFPSGAWPRSLE
jgi:hypothetical protein